MKLISIETLNFKKEKQQPMNMERLKKWYSLPPPFYLPHPRLPKEKESLFNWGEECRLPCGACSPIDDRKKPGFFEVFPLFHSAPSLLPFAVWALLVALF